VCGGPATAAHHVIEKATLKRELKPEFVDEALMDPANALPLCAEDHARHHSWAARIDRELLAECHWGFADRYGLAWALERSYPSAEKSAG
jgi:hypothetical protein